MDREDREFAGRMGGIHFTFHVFPDASGVGEVTSDDRRSDENCSYATVI
jgi:hypothetical protein